MTLPRGRYHSDYKITEGDLRGLERARKNYRSLSEMADTMGILREVLHNILTKKYAYIRRETACLIGWAEAEGSESTVANYPNNLEDLRSE